MSASKPVYEDAKFHVEPAHPGVIKLHDDLIDIYRVIRDRYQSAIDQAFDDVSRQIGFVIMTTLPVTLKVEGASVSTMLVGENLRGRCSSARSPRSWAASRCRRKGLPTAATACT